MPNKAYKFRIYPNKEQCVLFAKTFGCVRFIYNQMLADKIRHYKETKESLNNTPAQYKQTYPWLKEVDSLALANAQMHLRTAYKNFFTKPNIGYPKYKSKKSSMQKYTTSCTNGNISLANGKLKLPKVGYVKVRQHRDIPKNYKLKSVTISQTGSGKYYASILYEYQEEIVSIGNPKNFLGLDYSMRELYVDSNGEKAAYPHYYQKAEGKLKKEQRKLSKMKKGSKNREKQRRRIAKLHEKIANQRKDFLHKKSRQIANANDCVCIEDLNMKSLSQRMHFGKSVSDNGWGMFTQFLRYKLKEQGKKLIKVDKFFPSSQLCSCCGYRNTQTKDLSIRKWTCPKCGRNHDRDINAAINIKNEGMRIVST